MTRGPQRRRSLLALTTLGLACAHGDASRVEALLPEGPLPAGLSLRALAAIDRGAPFGWAPDGRQLALVRDGLRLRRIDAGTERRIDAASPTALAWSADGRLAAALPAGDEQSTLKIFAADGRPLERRRVPGRVTALVWGDRAGPIALALQLKRFSFGGQLRTLLLRWTEAPEPVVQTVAETVLHPARLRGDLGPVLAGCLLLSPLGDEVVLTHFQDPPNVAPYRAWTVRHLRAGGQREVARIGLDTGCGALSADAERLLLGDGTTTRWIALWSGERGRAWTRAGHLVARSPSGRHLLLDGALLRDRTVVASFRRVDGARFAPDGTRLALRAAGRLYLLSGLQDGPAFVLDADRRARLLQLRAWRSKGLISSADYDKAKQKVLQP